MRGDDMAGLSSVAFRLKCIGGRPPRNMGAAHVPGIWNGAFWGGQGGGGSGACGVLDTSAKLYGSSGTAGQSATVVPTRCGYIGAHYSGSGEGGSIGNHGSVGVTLQIKCRASGQVLVQLNGGAGGQHRPSDGWTDRSVINNTKEILVDGRNRMSVTDSHVAHSTEDGRGSGGYGGTACQPDASLIRGRDGQGPYVYFAFLIG